MEKDRKIKILLVVCNNVLNGTERYVVDLASSLSKDLFEVAVATPMTGPLSEILLSKNIKEISFDNGKLNKYSFKGLLNIKKLIKKNGFDVLHANSGFLPCIIGKLKRVKLVIEIKHGIFYSQKQLDSLPLLRKYYERIKKYFVDMFIATSPNDKDLMVKYFKIPESKIGVIFLGLDSQILVNQTRHLNTEHSNKSIITIGHIGRLTFQKAQIVLLKSFKLLSEKYKNVRLVIIGDGEDKNELENFINTNSLSEKVFFKGYVKQVYQEMLNFDMHVLTSRFEGMGYVNLEAMALGIPVITSNVGGVSNFLEDGYNALITPVDDPESTKNAMEKLINDENLRNKIIKNAKETVKSYTVERMAEETGKFYLDNL